MIFPPFEQWLRESTFANIYRHGLELADEMDASLRRRVKAEIMSAARNDHNSRSIEGLRRLCLVGETLS